MIRGLILAVFVVLSGYGELSGQYYSTGQAPARQKWNSIATDSLEIIYPREFDGNARRTLFYMEAARQHINHGFSHAPLKTPVVINTENFFSNGLAMLAPKRIEIGAVPDITPYSTPWLKQLAVHEYRHMVQYANINRSTVKVFSYIFGQQASLLATGLLPFWLLEGDAVMAETQFSEFGRGLQPSYTMHYRAMGRDMLSKHNPDKWFSGSYKDHVPSHYELGYQLVAHSERKFGTYIWDDIARFGSDYPFLLFTTQLRLFTHYDTSTPKLFRETFGYLNDYWDSLPQRDDSAEALTSAGRTYTTYEYPLYLDDGRILALKTDFDRPQRFVIIDPADGSEQHLFHTGPVSTRPALGNGEVWWTEYRPSMFWAQKTGSVMRSMKVGEWKPTDHDVIDAALYPVPVPEGGAAWVEYHYDGHYSIVRGGKRLDCPHGTSIHGLAYDDVTDKIYFLALSDAGMSVASCNGMDEKSVVLLFTPLKVSLSGLSARGGKLYYGSILSGYDEAYMYDLTEGRQYRLTTSRYGSFSPSPSPDGRQVAVTVYDRDGYRVAVQSAENPAEEPLRRKGADNLPSCLPENIVNPPTADWGLPKIDSIYFKAADLAASEETKPAKRYRKGLHLFNFHSWIPGLDVVPENLIAGDFNINLGATLISQNTLGTATSNFAYGYTQDRHSLLRGTFRYLGWAPKIEVDALWSDRRQTVSQTVENQPAPEGRLHDHITASARVYLPMLLTSGYRVRSLTPSVQYLYRNSLYWEPFEGRYIKGEHLVAGVVAYSDNVRRARLDLQPRWGYALRATVVGDPLDEIHALTGSIYGRVYTPGLFRHHGLSLAAAYQNGFGKGNSNYGVLDILPRGLTNIYPKEYTAVSANYVLPVAYPDWGLSGVFFLKRIHMGVGFDYALYTDETKYLNAPPKLTRGSAYSVGGTVNFDIAFLRLPSEGTCTISLSLYVPYDTLRPQDTGKPVFSAGFSVPL